MLNAQCLPWFLARWAAEAREGRGNHAFTLAGRLMADT